MWAQQDAKVIVGLLVLLGLAAGGIATARVVANASTGPPTKAGLKVVTMRQKVKVRVHGHLVTRWRTRKVYARAHTVMQTQTIHTANGTRVVTRPVVRYRVAYRKKVIKVNGESRTVMQPVTSSQTVTNLNTRTQVVTSTHQVTETRSQTVTQPVTVVETTTVVSTETDTVPITVTVTVPTISVP